MKSQRIDHLHIKINDFRKVVDGLQGIIGNDFLMEMEFKDNGMQVGFNPFPNGLEAMSIVDSSKQMAAIYEAWPGEGVFALSLKVEDIEAATSDMISQGYPQLMRYDFGEIKEALFDTTHVLPFYIELIESPDDITDADYGEL